MKNLELMGVRELDAVEMRNGNGGSIALAIAIAGACIYVYNNWDDLVAGVKEGYNETRK
ncbi:hypothetical protein [Roseimarinus sediminis]|uniref:hypothetical protein n=1 Tax=Roseimarinus sediminis TaxID=1610899 RepID=UPI003D20E30E